MEFFQASFEDIDEFCAMVQSWDVEMSPLTRIDKGMLSSTVAQYGSMDCQFGYYEFSTGLTMMGAPPNGLITFNVQEPSKRHYWWRGHDLDSSMAWVFPVGGELRSISAPGFQVHTLSVTEELVAQIAASWGMDLPVHSKRPEVFPVPEQILEQVLLRLNGMRNRKVGFSDDQAKEILQLLVPQWLQQITGKPSKRPAMRARYRALRRSLEIIEASDMQELTMDSLRRSCHASERTLQYAFRECFEMSPAAFLKSIRLARARTALLHSDPEHHIIGDIAARQGIWHLGQFAVDYREKFGELPSDTLARPPE